MSSTVLKAFTPKVIPRIVGRGSMPKGLLSVLQKAKMPTPSLTPDPKAQPTSKSLSVPNFLDRFVAKPPPPPLPKHAVKPPPLPKHVPKHAAKVMAWDQAKGGLVETEMELSKSSSQSQVPSPGSEPTDKR